MTEWILKARIDPEGCIGCIKCLRFCPTDAIVGTKKSLHVVLPDRCTSCGKCIDVCPTDCITLHTPAPPLPKADEQRLTARKLQRMAAKNHFEPQTILTQTQLKTHSTTSRETHKDQVAAAIERARARREKMKLYP